MTNNMFYELENLIKLIIGIQGVLIIAFITQFISNLTIITNLPKIKRLCKKMYYGEDEDWTML